MNIRWGTFLVLLMLFCVAPAGSESVRNYGDCAICHGTITYGPQEARDILGKEVASNLPRLAARQNVVVYIDQESTLPPSQAPETKDGYELKIIVTDQLLYVTMIEDGSSFMMELNQGKRGYAAFHPETFESWSPVIYLGAHEKDEISLEDDLELAWAKLKASGVHRLVHSFDDDFESGLQKTVMYAISATAGK